MSGKRDSLKYAIGRAKLSGSAKTQYNHKREALRFVEALRVLGYGVERWDKLTNKHVAAVAEYWRSEQRLKSSTIKEYLSGVRSICKAYGNNRINAFNNAFNVEERSYVTNQDKRLPQEVYESARKSLVAGDGRQQRLAVQLTLMRELGLRHEEARKLNPERCILPTGAIFITDGTKGGRDRILHDPSPRQFAAVEAAKPYVGRHGNTMPDDVKERAWEAYVYRQIASMGIGRASTGASLHGLRYAYACERYEQLSGFAAPCLFETKAAFQQVARTVAGDEWEKRDEAARLILKSELGHGPDRDDVVSVYVGSAK
jgi:integrase